MKRKHLLGLFAVLTPLAAMGCAAILGLDDPIVDKATASDAGDGSTANGDGGDTDGQSGDAGPDVTFQYTYNDITQLDNWEVMDLARISSNAISYGGGAFDGRWLYLSPSANGANSGAEVPLVRYDTSKNLGGDFSNLANWEAYNPRTRFAAAKGFNGAVFDGRYVYYVPTQGFDDTLTGLVLRFDTQAPKFDSVDLNAVPALDAVDLPTLFPNIQDDGGIDPGPVSYYGGVYDADHKCVYFVPGLGGAQLAARLDLTKDFKSTAAWSFLRTVQIPGNEIRGFMGGVLAGKYLYFVPYRRNGQNTGFVVRYDTSASFDQVGSWTLADMTQVFDTSTSAYNGAGFDGRHVYFAPRGGDNLDSNGRFVRLDTTGAFTSSASNSGQGGAPNWEVFQPNDAGLGKDASVRGIPDGGYFDPQGYSGTAFDGRYMYFVPSYRSVALPEPSVNSLVVQYDTTKPFGSLGSWNFFEASQLISKATVADGGGGDAAPLVPGYVGGFVGAIFDGAYVYFVPTYGQDGGRFALRYFARSTGDVRGRYVTEPKGHPSHGSFF